MKLCDHDKEIIQKHAHSIGMELTDDGNVVPIAEGRIKKKAEAYLKILVGAEFEIRPGEDPKRCATEELYKVAWEEFRLTRMDGELSEFTVFDA